MAREKLDKEINILDIVKSWRYFDSALRFLLPEGKRMDLKERARYIAINPDTNQVKETKRRQSMLAKRTKSIRRVNMSDGFFSSEEIDDEVNKHEKDRRRKEQ